MEGYCFSKIHFRAEVLFYGNIGRKLIKLNPEPAPAGRISIQEGVAMISIEMFIGILSFGIGCFSVGYMIGRNK